MSRRAELNVALCHGNPAHVCGYCGGSLFGNLPCKRRTCPRYADYWARDWRIVLLEAFIAYEGKATIYTLTPPGVEVLPWDRSKCGHPPHIPCSGPIGCRIADEPRRSWNESCQRRLSRIYETAQEATRREVGRRANLLAMAKEAQKRGAVHVHFAIGCETASELRAAKAFRRHLERLSANPRYEFGHVNGKFLKPKPAREAAAYPSSYFVAGRGHKAPLTEAVMNPELPRLPLYVSRRLTKVTRCTMRNKRRQRHSFVCAQRRLPMPTWWHDEKQRLEVIALALPVVDRIRAFERLADQERPDP